MHYAPGSWVYSIATTGCNFMCQYCINYDISQRRKVEGTDMTPSEVVENAIKSGCEGIAYTYNEPTIFIEFARDCGILARQRGLFNVFVSNGYGTPESVGMMKEFLDCITVDFKGNAEPKFVRRYIGIPDPQPIFDNIREIRDKTKIHLEITDLVVPRVGDDLEAARKLVRFVYDELGPDMPIQFLRFYPEYKMTDYPQTPVEMLEKHYEIAKSQGLRYVYIGNVPDHKWAHTYCPECNNMVVGRFGPFITKWHLDDENRCNFCGNYIPITGKLTKPLFSFRLH
jgi:pyruvate formate lyase activating enzyme